MRIRNNVSGTPMDDGKHVSYGKAGNIKDIQGCDVILSST
jgi:hypothetical protein